MYKGIDNLPEIYLQKSRTFQMFARLADILFLGKKYKISRVNHLYDALACPEEVLPLLSESVGFYPRTYISNEDLRVIIKAFPWLYKWKGSQKAIDMAVRIGLVLQGINPRAELKIQQNKCILYADEQVDTTIIKELFNHIAPVGYEIAFEQTYYEDRNTQLEQEGEIRLSTATYRYQSSLYDTEGNMQTEQWKIRDFVVADQEDNTIENPFEYAQGLIYYDTLNGVRGGAQTVGATYDGIEYPANGVYTSQDNPTLVPIGSQVKVFYVRIDGQWYRREVMISVPLYDQSEDVYIEIGQKEVSFKLHSSNVVGTAVFISGSKIVQQNADGSFTTTSGMTVSFNEGVYTVELSAVANARTKIEIDYKTIEDTQWMINSIGVLKITDGEDERDLSRQDEPEYNFWGTVSDFEPEEGSVEWFIGYTVGGAVYPVYYSIPAAIEDIELPVSIKDAIASTIPIGTNGTNVFLAHRLKGETEYKLARTFDTIIIGTKGA